MMNLSTKVFYLASRLEELRDILKIFLRTFGHFLLTEKKTWLYPAIMALILSFAVYGALPSVGISIFKLMFEPKTIISVILVVLGTSLFLYTMYMCYQKPERFLQIFVLYYVLIICVLAFVLKRAGVLPGSSSPFVITAFSSYELVTLFAIPTLIISLPHIFGIFWRFPYIFFQCVFFVIFVVCIFVHNTDVPFPTRWVEGIPNPENWRLFQVQNSMICYSILLSLAAAAVFHRSKSFHDTFDRFNKAVVMFYLCEAIVSLAGVPLGMFQQNVDGHVRFKSRFIHPNAYGHHLAIFLVYCLGLTLYYQKLKMNGINRFSMPMILGCFTLNMATFFLALSKGAISLSFISMIVLLLINFPFLIQNIKLVFQAIGAGIGLIPVGLLVIQFTKEGGVLGFVESTFARVEDTDSFDWRKNAWAALMNNLSEPWFGHGLTSSSLLLYHIGYHPKWNPLPLIIVHNTYYQLIYDMGYVGLITFFIPFALLLIVAIYIAITVNKRHPCTLPLVATLVGLTMYYLLSMTIDEVSLYDLHLLYWPLATMIYGLMLQFRNGDPTQLTEKNP